jgi:hypothetical protein
VGDGGAPVVVKSLSSKSELVVRQPPASKVVNTEAEEATLLEAVTRQPVKKHQSEKNYCVL